MRKLNQLGWTRKWWGREGSEIIKCLHYTHEIFETSLPADGTISISWLAERMSTCQQMQISSRDEGIPSAVLWYAVSDMICDCSTQNIQGRYFLTLRSSQCSSIKLRRIIIYCNCLFHFFRDNTWSKKWRGYRIAALWHQWWRRDLLACSWLKPTHLSIKDS